MHTNRIMVAIMVALVAFALAPTVVRAHGPAGRVMGTARTVEEERLHVETPDGHEISIEVTGETRFRDQAGDPAERSDLGEGDRVVVDVTSSGGSTVAEEIRFARPKKGEGSSSGHAHDH